MLAQLSPIDRFTVQKPILALFTDIDDTMTSEGQLEADAYKALWDLKSAGIAVIPVTGRPAGWCELIARLWPVTAVIGENGAFYFQLKHSSNPNGHGVQTHMHRHYAIEPKQMTEYQKTLREIEVQVLSSVPRSQVASDQFCRMFDLAIDFAEDVVPRLNSTAIQSIVKCFEERGATAKVSSIHVNGWFGTYDKLSMTKTFCVHHFGTTFEELNSQLVFSGDSPNDEPMFQAFQNSVGVANITDFLNQLKHPPRYVTRGRGGSGFVELAQRLIQTRT